MNTSPLNINNLFLNLKSIVHLIIVFPGTTLMSQYGAIERIRSAILSILLHGFKKDKSDTYEHLWQLIIQLNSNSQKYIHLLQDIYHKENLRTSIEEWISESILTECLSDQLSSMENNNDLLDNYYYNYAYMRVSAFYRAFIICIRTIESNNSSLLATIDPKLVIIGFGHAINNEKYISCSSTKASLEIKNSLSSDGKEDKNSSYTKQHALHRRIHSDPIVQSKSLLATSSNPILLVVPCQNDFKKENNQDTSLNADEYILNHDDSYTSQITSIEQSLSFQSSRSSISSQITVMHEKVEHIEKSIEYENVSKSISNVRLSHSSLFLPRKGQLLENYIRDCDSQTRTDVEKENAHLYLSEAILSAIEYIKFNRNCKSYFDLLDQDTNTFSFSNQNSNMTPTDFTAEAIALAIMEDWKNHKIPTARELFWMIPQVSVETSEELNKNLDNTINSETSNELSIDINETGRRRGNSQWAPLREQLIFHIHQSISRDSQLKKQSFLCAGCGRHVVKGSADRFRYCEYTGKYFCRICHSDKRFYLLSHIITKWDFSKNHSISNFAYDYLNRIYEEPIFTLIDLNGKLYEKSTTLKMINELRWALHSFHSYISTCRFAEQDGYQKQFEALPSHIYQQPYTFSMKDMVQTKAGELYKSLEPIAKQLREHVLKCSLCYEKGYICELCKDDKSIIFPFDIKTTSICSECQSCFHARCHKNNKYNCPKCQRARQRTLVNTSN